MGGGVSKVWSENRGAALLPWICHCRRFAPRHVLNYFPPISIGTSWQPKSLSGKRAGHYQRRAGDELMASWHPTMIFLFLSFPLVNAAVRWRNSQWSITHHLVADKHILLPMKSRTFFLFNWCGRLIVACFSKIVQQVKGASAREISSCKQLLLAGGDFLRARVFC